MTQYVGLIGRGLKHSISPQFQQAAFDHLGLDVHYEIWDTEENELPSIVEGLRRPPKLGANVTIPYKEAVLPLLDEVDSNAAGIGAVNTIVNYNGKLAGHNTDSSGFMMALEREGGFDPTGKTAVLLGSGGVARAASFMLISAGIKSLVVTDIIADKMHGLVTDLKRVQAGGREPFTEIMALSADDPRYRDAVSGCDLLVNCTPIGMKHSTTEGRSPIEADLIPKGALVYDLVYNPLETVLMKAARESGAHALHGLSMLVYQGAAAFELWTEREAPIDIMMDAARKSLE
ncbi:MAG: shikimate dehydrogenase [Dehalococcoidia bacterium]|nr:MAG: shikimate dehydrogenase [Dehalococcoidia bacterium]